MKLGDIIAPYANAKGFRSKAELARASGVSVSTIYSIWNRPCKVSWIENAAKLAEALDMPLELIYEERTQGRRKHSQVDPVKHSQKIKQGRSLCWSCRNAVPDGKYGCPWSMDKTPVEGWVADKHVQKGYEAWGNPGLHITYKVLACPMFVPDPPKKNERKKSWLEP